MNRCVQYCSIMGGAAKLPLWQVKNDENPFKLRAFWTIFWQVPHVWWGSRMPSKHTSWAPRWGRYGASVKLASCAPATSRSAWTSLGWAKTKGKQINQRWMLNCWTWFGGKSKNWTNAADPEMVLNCHGFSILCSFFRNHELTNPQTTTGSWAYLRLNFPKAGWEDWREPPYDHWDPPWFSFHFFQLIQFATSHGCDRNGWWHGFFRTSSTAMARRSWRATWPSRVASFHGRKILEGTIWSKGCPFSLYNCIYVQYMYSIY